MTVDQIISLCASIGACLAAIAALLSVWQIKRQRELSYHPEMALSQVAFEGNSPSENYPPVDWRTNKQNNIENDSATQHYLHYFSIPLCNVGLGAAKELNASWSYPITDMLKNVNEIAQRTMTQIHVTFEGGIFNIKSEGAINSMVVTKNSDQQIIDYVLPASIHNKETLLRIPISYIYLVSLFIFLSIKEQEGKKKKAFDLDIPSIKLNLEYTDIASIKHSSSFTLVFNLCSIVPNGNFSFSAFFQPKKCI